jgi:hypothetical protein
MTAIILPFPPGSAAAQSGGSSERVLVKVNIEAEVLSANAAMHKAHAWLVEHVSDLLEAATAELILGERLLWRFEVLLALPNTVQPGSGALYRIGQIRVDAASGDVENAEALAAELRVHVTSLAP